ncbi:hypothetical protein Shyhy02_38890 [Streptomyces hygroscopicus subsp. hygroscopicus]|nr:hypothetical protein Shyhy02_38890 [Streptomyces hygroscopicus subsp. hygroscopicus]
MRLKVEHLSKDPPARVRRGVSYILSAQPKGLSTSPVVAGQERFSGLWSSFGQPTSREPEASRIECHRCPFRCAGL